MLRVGTDRATSELASAVASSTLEYEGRSQTARIPSRFNTPRQGMAGSEVNCFSRILGSQGVVDEETGISRTVE